MIVMLIIKSPRKNHDLQNNQTTQNSMPPTILMPTEKHVIRKS